MHSATSAELRSLAPGTTFALANARHGSDLDPADDDISATFNSNWGTAGCGAASSWYYGLDGNAPASSIDFVTVLLHELGHGLGFSTFVSLSSGAKAGGFDDAYMRFLEHHGATPSGYPAMSNPQRVAASISTGNLHWIGTNVRAASGVLSAGKVGDHVRMFAPNRRSRAPRSRTSIRHSLRTSLWSRATRCLTTIRCSRFRCSGILDGQRPRPGQPATTSSSISGAAASISA